MAIVVKCSAQQAGDSIPPEQRVEDGYNFSVEDGALVVLGPDEERLALFAAGSWTSAQVED